MGIFDMFKRKDHGYASSISDLDTIEDQGAIFGNSYLNQQEGINDTWITPEIPMATLYRYYKTAYLLNSTVNTHTEHSVGNSFHITANTDTAKGKEAFELINKFAYEINLEKLNRQIAIDMWIAGNCFMTPLELEKGDKKELLIKGAEVLPLSSFVAAYRDRDGNISKWRRYSDQHAPDDDRNSVMADDILQFSRNNENGSPWGNGVGQVVCRRGVGYNNTSKKRVIRPALVEVWEMLDDVLPKQVYGGLPKFFGSGKGASKQVMDQLGQKLAKANPLQTVMTNADIKIESLMLDTKNRFNDALMRIQNASILALQNPMIQLWTSMSFTYASSKEAMEAMMPLIKGYERDHKRFIEQYLFRPVIEYYMDEKAWDKVNIELHWGEPDNLELDSIETVTRIASYPIMRGRLNPDDIINMLKESGIEVSPVEQEEKQEPPSKLDPVEDPDNPEQDDIVKHLEDARKTQKHAQSRKIQDAIEQQRLEALRRFNQHYKEAIDDDG